MKNSKISFVAILCVFLLTVVSLTTLTPTVVPAAPPLSPAEAKVYKLKFTSDASIRNPKCATLYDWAKLLNDRTDGHIKMEIYPAGQLYNDRDAINAISTGIIEMCQPPGTLLATVDRNFEVEFLPSMIGLTFKQYDKARKEKGGVYGKLLEIIEEKLGVKVLGQIYGGNNCFGSKVKPIRDPKDFTGLKLRSYGSAIAELKMKATGAEPVVIAWPECYTALQQGVVDGLETSMAGFNQQKLWEVCKYLIMTDHIRASYYVMINRKAWDSLPPKYQQIMLETFPEYQALQDERIHKGDAAIEQNAIAGGGKVIHWTPDALARYREMIMPIEDAYVEKYRLDPEIIKLAKQAWEK